MKYIDSMVCWACVFACIGACAYFDHVENMECIKRGGQMRDPGGCSPNYCEVSK